MAHLKYFILYLLLFLTGKNIRIEDMDYMSVGLYNKLKKHKLINVVCIAKAVTKNDRIAFLNEKEVGELGMILDNLKIPFII